VKAATRSLTLPGWTILGAVTCLFLIGLATIYVTDTHVRPGHDGPYNAKKQLIFMAGGVVAGAFVLRIGYRRIGRHAYAIFLAVLVLLIPLLIARMTHTTFGGLIPSRRNAYRWIQLPVFQLQPSEFMKIAYILALAWYLRYRRNYRRFGGLVRPLLASAIPLMLILRQPDLGTCMIMLPVLFIMLFLAGAKSSHLAIILAIALAAAPLAWAQIHRYQRLRIAAVLLQSDSLREAIAKSPHDRYAFLASKRDAVEWAASSGYQLLASKTAIGSGGVFGHGWGRGPYVERQFLPDRHNDLIFAVIAHQWGMIGCLVVLAAYAAIIVAGAVIASQTREPFGRLLAVGVIALLATQITINIGMAVGLMPITGMNLPFVSYGGSSLLSNFLACALLISVSQRRPYLLSRRPFDFMPRRVRRLIYDAEVCAEE